MGLVGVPPNVSSEAQVPIFFLFHRKVMFHSQYIQVCVFHHPLTYKIFDVRMTITT